MRRTNRMFPHFQYFILATEPEKTRLNPLRHPTFPPDCIINTYNNSECCCVISFYKTVKPQLTPRLAPFIGPRLPATPFCFFFFPRSPAAPIVSPAIIIVFIVLYLFVIFFLERFVAKIRTCHRSNTDATFRGDALQFF